MPVEKEEPSSPDGINYKDWENRLKSLPEELPTSFDVKWEDDEVQLPSGEMYRRPRYENVKLEPEVLTSLVMHALMMIWKERSNNTEENR